MIKELQEAKGIKKWGFRERHLRERLSGKKTEKIGI